MDYISKTYGRKDEVEAIYAMLAKGIDISMPGPRRLGKTFVLDRLVESGPAHGWNAIKVEVAGCTQCRDFFRQLCKGIGSYKSAGRKTLNWLRQRLGQVVDPRSDSSEVWYQPFVSTDHQTYFERLIKALNDDKRNQWVLLIDELPIFLKALHDKGPQGIEEARNFMNNVSRLRVDYPNVRWLITGSIGLEPLAQSGNYIGVLAKFKVFTLPVLDHSQARDLIVDLADTGKLLHRTRITRAEADAVIEAVGWRSAFYLEALASKLKGEPSEDAEEIKAAVASALDRLIQPEELATFAVWEEHLDKHYKDADKKVAKVVLNALANAPGGCNLDELLTQIGQVSVTKDYLRKLLMRMHTEGFVIIDDWDSSNPMATFRNVLLRRWWLRFPSDPNS